MTEKTETTEVVNSIDFEYDGEKYVVPFENLDDVDFLEAREDGKYATATRLALGEVQWKKFKSKKRNTAQLLEVLVLALGINDED